MIEAERKEKEYNALSLWGKIKHHFYWNDHKYYAWIFIIIIHILWLWEK